MGPQIAEKLSLPQVTYVKSIEFSEGCAYVHRALEDGYEKLKVKLPCVLTAIKELNSPRYMSVPGILKACQKGDKGVERRGHRSGPQDSRTESLPDQRVQVLHAKA